MSVPFHLLSLRDQIQAVSHTGNCLYLFSSQLTFLFTAFLCTYTTQKETGSIEHEREGAAERRVIMCLNTWLLSGKLLVVGLSGHHYCFYQFYVVCFWVYEPGQSNKPLPQTNLSCKPSHFY